jgi:hypothetical protein
MLSGGLEVPAHARVGLRTQCFFPLLGSGLGCSSTAAVGPAGQRPSRCDGVYPSVSLSVVDHFSGFDTSMSAVAGGGRGRCSSPRSSFWDVVLGRVYDPL